MRCRFGDLFTYDSDLSFQTRYMKVNMLIPGYPDELTADFNPVTGTLWLWRFIDNDRIDYEPIKMGKYMGSEERKFKIRKQTTDRKEPYGYEW